ncbi:MAG: succinate dehydrogenase cytochrome b subunit [Prevotellaceae bacterium]|jgi:succinate dehydrogenase / fumarate reductase cytochrome b subunit|nr:succinate dehydrogenase cytochrome b subunit [Prevotellaceae bacterium]
MWLINSSIGRKFIMSITGIALVLFLLFHGTMNLVAIISPEAYNMICAFLGANWYALVATVGLAGLVGIHFLCALYLTFLNYRARGKERYAVDDRRNDVEWSSNNMLIIGAVVIGFLVLHLYNFWFKMQFVEIVHKLGGEFGDVANATNGALYIRELFASPVYCILYLVWLGALWLHLTHGIWSALQTLGFSNQVWFSRIKVISTIFATLIVLLFAAVVVWYGLSAWLC